MGNLKEEIQKVIDKCTTFYNKGGVTAVIDHVLKEQKADNPLYENVQYRYCMQCEDGYPNIDNTCLICGNDITQNKDIVYMDGYDKVIEVDSEILVFSTKELSGQLTAFHSSIIDMVVHMYNHSNSLNDIDEYLLNESQCTQEDREIIIEGLSTYIETLLHKHENFGKTEGVVVRENDKYSNNENTFVKIKTPEIGRKLHTIGEVRELLKDFDDNDIAVLEACDENGDVEDLYPMYIDVIEGIKLNDDTIVREVRFCQMPNTPLKIGTGIKDENKKEIRVGDVINPTKTVWVCPNCGSDNVQQMVLVNINENNKLIIFPEERRFKECHCNDCQQDILPMETKLIPSANVIGFQVVGEEGSKEEGNIHPDMDVSFGIYSLSQANEMLNGKSGSLINNLNDWRLLTIWEGDVEKSIIMFEGNVRD